MISSRHQARRAFAAAALSSFVVLVAACGGSPSPTADPTRTVTATATATPTPAAPAPAPSTAAPSGAPGPAGGPPPCPTRSLGVKLGQSQGAAGSTFQVIDFTNISDVTCSLYGFPGVSLAGGQPVTQIGQAAAENHNTARRLVTLAPGAVGNALLQVVDAYNFPSGDCHLVKSSYLQVYPPNQTTPAYVGYKSAACASKSVRLMTVNVVIAGSGGNT
jgi:Protein of unknown function (DUF4232)